MTTRPDVAVVGGGVIGLAVAWRCLQRGMTVTLVDAGLTAASRVAAGLLATVTDPESTSRDLARLNAASAGRCQAFCDELTSVTGCDIACRCAAAILVEREGDAPALLPRRAFARQAMWRDGEPLTATELRRLEPNLASAFERGFYLQDDPCVHGGNILAALSAAVTQSGGHRVPARAAAVRADERRVTGVD